MKRLLLIAVCVVVFISCEDDRDIDSLVGTTWGLHETYNEGWYAITITFTATHATITSTYSNRGSDIFTGTYTYDPPNVEIIGDTWIWEGIEVQMPYPLCHTGRVKGKILTLSIWESTDLITTGDYKKL